ncbi:MAG: hypothetical protein QW568_00025 [Candidatus Anstonellaceae archaeon]
MSVYSAFASTSQVLFGTRIGELGQFKEYLLEMVDQPLEAKSAISGKPIYLSRQHYAREAKFIDIAEAQAAAGKLNINQIKDIDSLLAAAAERFAYCGNKNLGISMNVEESDACNDSLDVLFSQNVMASKRVAYSHGIRESDSAFGCQLGGEVEFCMRCQIIFFSKRCFETYLSERCTDCYFCFNCRNCSDCLFCFNQNSKRHCIGNLELPKAKYLQLKKKLLGEVAEGLRAKKHFPSLFEMAAGGVVDG